MLVKCINPRFNHVHWGTDGNGRKVPKRIKVGDTFPIRGSKGVPPEWRGMVVAVDGSSEAKTAVTNPAEDPELTELKAEYREATGKAPHHTWDAEKIREKLDEHAASQ